MRATYFLKAFKSSKLGNHVSMDTKRDPIWDICEHSGIEYRFLCVGEYSFHLILKGIMWTKRNMGLSSAALKLPSGAYQRHDALCCVQRHTHQSVRRSVPCYGNVPLSAVEI